MSDRRQQAFQFFVQQGWSAEQSAGLVANLVAESGLRPDAVGDGGQAYGIAQWHPPRQSHFAGLMGKPIQESTFEEQLYFVHAELQSDEQNAGDALRRCVTAAEAGACVSKLYERPADREGEAAKRALLAESIYVTYGGSIGPNAPVTPGPQPQPTVATPGVAATPTEKPTMGALALLQLFGSFLGPLIPQIAPLLNPGSKAAQYAPIAQIVVDTITKNAGATNLQGAVEKMQSDPAVRLAVQQAVVTHPEVIGLMEIGGGIKAARESNLAIQQAEKPFIYNPAFWITLLLLPMAYWIVGSVLIGGIDIDENSWQIWKIFGREFDAETRSGMVNLVIGMVLGGICGIWFGTSWGSMRKTELAATATSEAVAK